MKYLILPVVCILLLGSCQQPASEPTPIITRDTVVIIQHDTVVVMYKEAKEAEPVVNTPPSPKKEKQPEQLKEVKATASDTTFHYYVNKKVSVKITPWVNEERWVLLYNLLGEETYRHKDIRKSYSVIAHLKFHPNGAVSKMMISENPGASQYWYETTITFSTINDPEQKVSERKPYPESPTINIPWEYWDKKTKEWRKQEVQE